MDQSTRAYTPQEINQTVAPSTSRTISTSTTSAAGTTSTTLASPSILAAFNTPKSNKVKLAKIHANSAATTSTPLPHTLATNYSTSAAFLRSPDDSPASLRFPQSTRLQSEYKQIVVLEPTDRTKKQPNINNSSSNSTHNLYGISDSTSNNIMMNFQSPQLIKDEDYLAQPIIRGTHHRVKHADLFDANAVKIRFAENELLVQPQFMMHRGSMSSSELWSTKLKRRFCFQELTALGKLPMQRSMQQRIRNPSSEEQVQLPIVGLTKSNQQSDSKINTGILTTPSRENLIQPPVKTTFTYENRQISMFFDQSAAKKQSPRKLRSHSNSIVTADRMMSQLQSERSGIVLTRKPTMEIVRTTLQNSLPLDLKFASASDRGEGINKKDSHGESKFNSSSISSNTGNKGNQSMKGMHKKSESARSIYLNSTSASNTTTSSSYQERFEFNKLSGKTKKRSVDLHILNEDRNELYEDQQGVTKYQKEEEGINQKTGKVNRKQLDLKNQGNHTDRMLQLSERKKEFLSLRNSASDLIALCNQNLYSAATDRQKINHDFNQLIDQNIAWDRKIEKRSNNLFHNH